LSVVSTVTAPNKALRAYSIESERVRGKNSPQRGLLT